MLTQFLPPPRQPHRRATVDAVVKLLSEDPDNNDASYVQARWDVEEIARQAYRHHRDSYQLVAGDDEIWDIVDLNEDVLFDEEKWL